MRKAFLAGVDGVRQSDPLLEEPGEVIELFDAVYLSLRCGDRLDTHRLEDVATCLRVVEAKPARVELHAVELEVAVEVGQEEVAYEAAGVEQALAVLVDLYCLVCGDADGSATSEL